MSVLDELRRILREDADDRLRYAKTEFIATEAAVRIVDAFEAAHPGLVDETIICCRCGNPAVRDMHRDIDICPVCAKVQI